MSTLDQIIYNENLSQILGYCESTARGAIEKILPDADRHIIRIQSVLSAQYVVQFSIKSFIKPENPVEQKVFKGVKKSILNLTNRQIDLINHSAKITAKATSRLLLSQASECVQSRILMLSQFSTLQDMDDSKLIEFFLKMDSFLKKSITDCTNQIRHSKFPKRPQQNELFGKNANSAIIKSSTDSLRNTKVKK